jgi:hypothetical protein
VKVTQPPPPEKEVPVEILATAIVDLDAAAKRLLNGPLKRRAVILLIHDICRVPLGDIERVLDAAADLKRRYVNDR